MLYQEYFVQYLRNISLYFCLYYYLSFIERKLRLRGRTLLPEATQQLGEEGTGSRDCMMKILETGPLAAASALAFMVLCICVKAFKRVCPAQFSSGLTPPHYLVLSCFTWFSQPPARFLKAFESPTHITRALGVAPQVEQALFSQVLGSKGQQPNSLETETEETMSYSLPEQRGYNLSLS